MIVVFTRCMHMPDGLSGSRFPFFKEREIGKKKNFNHWQHRPSRLDIREFDLMTHIFSGICFGFGFRFRIRPDYVSFATVFSNVIFSKIFQNRFHSPQTQIFEYTEIETISKRFYLCIKRYKHFRISTI